MRPAPKDALMSFRMRSMSFTFMNETLPPASRNSSNQRAYSLVPSPRRALTMPRIDLNDRASERICLRTPSGFSAMSEELSTACCTSLMKFEITNSGL